MVPGSGFVLVLGSGFRVRGSGFWVRARDMLIVRYMVARHYRELVCWQLSNDLKRRVYAIIAKPPASRDFEFCKQIRGSARGAPRTISEGFGRFRPREFARYLEFARASLLETQNHLDDALDNDYITDETHHELFKLADRAIGATTKLQQYLNNCKEPPRQDREPSTPNGNLKPRTKNPEPRTRNTEPRTRNTEPRTRNTEPRTKNEP